MKQLVGLGTLIATVLVAGAAHAQPAESASPASDASDAGLLAMYLGAGGEVGGNLNLMTGFYAEAGIAVHRDVFVHSRFAHGDTSDLSEAIGRANDSFAHGDSRYDQVRGGVELHACTAAGAACFIYGADLGVLWTSRSTGPTSDTPSSRYTEEAIIPRAGIDVGGKHVRARFAVEMAVGAAQRRSDDTMDNANHYGMQGTMFTGGLAYKF